MCGTELHQVLQGVVGARDGWAIPTSLLFPGSHPSSLHSQPTSTSTEQDGAWGLRESIQRRWCLPNRDNSIPSLVQQLSLNSLTNRRFSWPLWGARGKTLVRRSCRLKCHVLLLWSDELKNIISISSWCLPLLSTSNLTFYWIAWLFSHNTNTPLGCSQEY